MQRIFWRENAKEKLKEYWLTVVTYGMTSSAHNAVRAVIQCSKDAEKQYPEAAKTIINDFYMDDCVSGADTKERAIVLSKEIDMILKGGGFELRKWKSTQLMNTMCSDEEAPLILSDEEKASV